MSGINDSQHEDFFRYTGGRWLWEEESRLKERYKHFNVTELQRVATASVDGQACTSITKLAEGGSNKVFRLIIDNTMVLIARIPYPNAGPPFFMTASEVATMDFAKSILGIPVPKVTCWSARADNPVGSEYVIMEEACGAPLADVWDDMELPDKLKVTENIVALQTQLLSISFTKYGSLFFAADAIPGCERAEILGDTALKEEVENRYVIGPIAQQEFWEAEREHIGTYRGPWKTPESYLVSRAQREMAWLSQYARPKPSVSQSNFLVSTSYAQNSPESHLSLYNKYLAVIPYLLPKQNNLVRSTIWHCDLHASNIYVDGTVITSVIDWQDVWAGPLFLQVRQPQFVDYNGPMTLKLPENFETIDDPEEKSRIRTEVVKSMVLWSYELDTKKLNPDVYAIFLFPHGRTRRDVVHFAPNTWDGDIVPFRESLIRVARHFNKLSPETTTTTSCPIDFTEAELREHARDSDGWNETADFWDRMDGIANRDGWTSIHMYETALELFSDLREQALEDLTGEDREEFWRLTAWAARSNEDTSDKDMHPGDARP